MYAARLITGFPLSSNCTRIPAGNAPRSKNAYPRFTFIVPKNTNALRRDFPRAAHGFLPAALLLREVGIRLHFVDLLRVPFAVGRNEQHKLVAVELTQRAVCHMIAQPRRAFQEILCCHAAL